MTEKELMDKIKGEEKWLIHALNDQTDVTSQYSVDIAFDAVKHYVKDYIDSQQKESRSGKPNKRMSEARRWKRRYLDLKHRYLVLEQQTRWIPVSERVPEKGGDYLVTQKVTFTDYVYINAIGYALNLHDVDEYDFVDKKRPGWYEYDREWGYRELEDITAWMPLPSPYKAESEVHHEGDN